MALCMALFASLAGPVSRIARAHHTVALGMVIMAAGLYLVSRLGGGATFASLMPGFLIFGAGAGLMNVPLTTAIMHSMPGERSGMASALINASREVAGLLGITIIGAVLRSRESAALHHGASQAGAFLDGYHAGLLLTVALIAAGAIVSYAALRHSPRLAPAVVAPDAAELAEVG
jgi:hypothetical protein